MISNDLRKFFGDKISEILPTLQRHYEKCSSQTGLVAWSLGQMPTKNFVEKRGYVVQKF